jgi:hypothetical protein
MIKYGTDKQKKYAQDVLDAQYAKYEKQFNKLKLGELKTEEEKKNLLALCYLCRRLNGNFFHARDVLFTKNMKLKELLKTYGILNADETDINKKLVAKYYLDAIR